MSQKRSITTSSASVTTVVATAILLASSSGGGHQSSSVDAFCTQPRTSPAHTFPDVLSRSQPSLLSASKIRLDASDRDADGISLQHQELNIFPPVRQALSFLTSAAVAATIAFVGTSMPAFAENELSAKYGGGFDSSLIDKDCFADKCSLQVKSCLAEDPSCRKGLTCIGKCLGDNSCITGCMAQYGNKNLDGLLKCTIEDNSCIKVAILDGGADTPGTEPRPPAPTVRNFNVGSMEGQWYKVAGYNPNYDCYACQKNTFTVPETDPNSGERGVKGLNLRGPDKLSLDVRFSMPRVLDDGVTPPPPSGARETVQKSDIEGLVYGSQSIGFNSYQTRETMVFDRVDQGNPISNAVDLVLGKGTDDETAYRRTAHSEGEMFGLKFWENWYIIGENDPGKPEFKFVFYSGKTRQNTYDGAFVYSRSKDLGPDAMKKVYKIASDANMNPDQFCRIRNGCFKDDEGMNGRTAPNGPFRGILASTAVSRLVGIEPVFGEGVLKSSVVATSDLGAFPTTGKAEVTKSWWKEVGYYLENPHQHYQAMESLQIPMNWPKDIENSIIVNKK